MEQRYPVSVNKQMKAIHQNIDRERSDHYENAAILF